MAPPDPLPRNALELVDALKLKLLHLMALALYESGRPMTYEELHERLRKAGVDRPLSSLQKAWHGRPLLRRSRDGRFHLDTEDPDGDWRWVRMVVEDHLGLRRPPAAAPTLALVPPPAADDATPLTLEEARDAMRHRSYGTFTLRRCLIALVDAARRPLPVEEVLGEFAAVGDSTVRRIDIERSLRGLPGALRRTDDDRLVVDARHADLPRVRRMARERADQAAAQQRSAAALEKLRAAHHVREETEQARRRAWYEGARKLVLRAVFAGDRWIAGAVLDPDTRESEALPDVDAARARLEQAEIVFGLDPWTDLSQLAVPTQGRTLVDLSPPSKSRRLNARGRTLHVTPAMLMTATLNASRPLGDDAALRRLAAGGEAGKVRRRLEADVRALWRFCSYGQLHGYVRLRWGFLDEFAFVNWNVGRLPTLRQILHQAMEEPRPIVVVLGTAPGWSDPWARGRVCRVVGVERGTVQLEGWDVPAVVGEEEIAAIRWLEEGDSERG